jgi:hypothetical protein
MKKKPKYLIKKNFNKLMFKKRRKYNLNSLYYFVSKIKNVIDYSKKRNLQIVPRYKLLKNYRKKKEEEDSFKLGDIFLLKKRFKKRLFLKRRVFNKLTKNKRIPSDIQKIKLKKTYPLAFFLVSHINKYRKFLKSFKR